MSNRLANRKKPTRVTARTPTEKAHWIIERDLCILTGDELLKKYGHEQSAAASAFQMFTGHTAQEIAATHNPFYYYCLAVWFDNPEGREMISAEHRALADEILDLILGKLDAYDGLFVGQPRRSLKSTFLMAGMDWAAKRHWLVDGLDVSQFYTHNSLSEAISRSEVVKNKNRWHPHILRYFPEFQIPVGEWYTKDEWSWPFRVAHTSVADPSIRAMSIQGKKAGKGAHYRWLDDCEDEESRDSEQVRKNVSDGYDQLRQLEAPAFSRECFADTPYHIHGLTLTLKDAKRSDGTARYRVRWIPALDDSDRPAFPKIRKLTVEGLAKERANEIARTGSDTFWYLQYMLEARLVASQAMQWEWFRELTSTEYHKSFRPVAHFRGLFLDTAWKGQQNQGHGDYTVIAAIGIWRFGERYERVILDQVVSNEMTSDEGGDEVVRLMRKWAIVHVIPEQPGEKTFEGTLRPKCRQNGVYPVVIDLKGWSKKKKEDRRSALASGARTGGVSYLTGLPHLEITKKQLEEAGIGALHDDVPDCWAMSFAPEIIDRWVPVGIEPAPRKTEQEDLYPTFPTATRYSGVPAIFH